MEHLAVAFCADRNIQSSLHVATSSVLRHMREQMRTDFYLLLEGYTSRDIRQLHKTLDDTGKPYTITLLQHDVKDVFDNCRKFRGNHMAYYRLLLPHIVSEERILYLDADTLTTIDLSPLRMLDLNGYSTGCVIHGKIKEMIEHRLFAELGLDPEAPALNSGVLLMDTRRWREDKITEQCMEFFEKHASRAFTADQAALNVVLYQNAFYLPHSFNQEIFPEVRLEDKTADPCVIHFVGVPKPWDLFGEFLHHSYKHYHHELRKTSRRHDEIWKYFVPQNYKRIGQICINIAQLIHSQRMERISSSSQTVQQP